jgi:hypothetical protein
MPKKLSAIAKKMAASVLQGKDPSPEAVAVALRMVHLAWNFADEDYDDEPGYRFGLRETEQAIAAVKHEFIEGDAQSLVEMLMKHKRKHYPKDKRAIFSCEYQNGNVRVTWA